MVSHTANLAVRPDVTVYPDQKLISFPGGIVPAVKEYAGTSSTTSDVGLEYYGGKVTVNTAPVLDHERSGLGRTYIVTQQGLSAHITCSALDPNDPQYSISVQSSALDSYGIMFWNMTTKCPLGGMSARHGHIDTA
jgi:hypothetical protein